MSFPLLTPPLAMQDIQDLDRLESLARDDRPTEDPTTHLEQQFFVEWEVPEAL